ncbi:hypothetical protein BDV38DRAFT_276525 [Aspergillus pseudotamarii]|uniref:Uncharacterized protein n=1 Tax=Aspergillus pseudotamarii TaxID=132259 RepID=A0A5N6S7W1_ASPPS|nr:uncharacterized protein BDV38DRAFT_276525 [Aspergillus pseudotamarii]KAE8130756.1 hypothetical protein BDV38DRAFT_276525 [Aspergillus pseudotamarii]
MDLLTDTERRLTVERLLKFQGTAKIDLNQISLQPLMSREIDQKNVERLRDIFAKDGCQRLDIRNHVTAVVFRQHLERACHAAGLTPEELKTCQPQYPRLLFRRHQVQCLHGQHRLKAAEETLPPSDRWWTVDIYLDDISPDLRTALIDEYANEKAPTDGEVYRKIRQYQQEANALFQNRWWTRLSPNKAKRLRQLTSPDNTHLCAAFDALLAIPGLWNGMSLGLLNTVLALKCDEELIHYLTHVKNFWATLVNHDRTRMTLIDLHTVDTLQLYAPRASKVDRKTVKGKILGGEVFSNFSRSERAAIWKTIRTHEMCDGIIPSLHTFFRDISYLELCANAVKRLVVLNKQQPTVRSALVHSFRSRRVSGSCLIQTSETSFRRQPGSRDERISSGYRQIWMYAMRHYPDMAKDLQRGPKANPTRAKARARADESVIHGMATLAKQLGFHTPPIKAILRQSPDQQIARAALLKARKPDHYHYDHETFESLVEQIAGYFALAIPNEAAPVAYITGRAIQLKERCGVPQEQTQQLDRPHIFFDTLHSATVSQRNLSSLEVRRSVYYAFFGKPSPTTSPRASPGHPSSSEPLSPLFIPSDVPRSESEPAYDNMSINGSDEASFHGRQDRSETPEEQHQRQGDRSDAEHPIRRQIAEQPPAGSRGMDSDSEEPEDTEIDEDDLRNRSEGGSPGVEDTAAVVHSISGAPDDTEMSSVPDEGADAVDGAMDMGSSALTQSDSVEDRAGIPTTLSHQSSVQSPTIPTVRKDATWEPYDATQKGNCNVTKRSLAARGQSIAQGTMTNSEPSAEQRPGFGPLQPIAEHTELEVTRSVDEPDGAERISGGPLPAEAQQGTVGEQIPPGTELIAGAGGESQEDLVARERADALDQLQTPGAIPRPLTELPLDLPDLITRLRDEGSQLKDESVPLANHPTQGHPEPGAGVAPPRTEPPVPSAMENSRGSPQDDENVPQSPRQRLRTSPQPRKSDGVRKLRAKNRLAHQDPNRAGTRDAAIADEIWNSDDGDENLAGVADAGPSPLDTERYPANTPKPEQAQREAIDRQEEEDSLFDTPHSLEEADSQEMEEAQRRVTITFQVYERSQWSTTDVVSVSLDHLAEAQTLADGYARDPNRNARFYDGQLRKVAVDECIRAAIEDAGESQRRHCVDRTRSDAGGSSSDGDQRTHLECERATQPQNTHASDRRSAGAGCAAPSGRGNSSARDDRTAHEVVVDRSDPSQVERVARKEARNRQATFYDKNLRLLTPAQCFKAAIEDDTNTIFMHFGGELAMDEDTMRSIARDVEL